jgi:hypothetical protein
MALRTFRIRADRRHYAILARRYQAERVGLAFLEPYPTLDDLVATLSGKERADFATRSRLVAAVVARIQAGSNPALWSAIVLDAFRGMLGKLIRKLKGVDPEEAPSIVAEGFAEALRRVKPERDPDLFALSLRQEARRLVFRRVRRGRMDAFPKPPPPPKPKDKFSWFDPPPEVDVDDLADPSSLPAVAPKLTTGALAARGVSSEDLLLAHGVRGGLRRLAKHLFPDADAREHDAIYRVLLRRARALSTPADGPEQAGEG